MKIVIVADVEPHPDFAGADDDHLYWLLRTPLINLLMDNELEFGDEVVGAINKVPAVYR